MTEVLEYKGYVGSVEVSKEDRCLHGAVLFVRDLVTYEGKSYDELEAAFQSAVDNYVATCKAIGRDPEKPCSGTFNVRVGQELHRAAQQAAAKRGIGLNELVKVALQHELKLTEAGEDHVRVLVAIQKHGFGRDLEQAWPTEAEVKWTTKLETHSSQRH